MTKEVKKARPNNAVSGLTTFDGVKPYPSFRSVVPSGCILPVPRGWHQSQYLLSGTLALLHSLTTHSCLFLGCECDDVVMCLSCDC